MYLAMLLRSSSTPSAQSSSFLVFLLFFFAEGSNGLYFHGPRSGIRSRWPHIPRVVTDLQILTGLTSYRNIKLVIHALAVFSIRNQLLRMIYNSSATHCPYGKAWSEERRRRRGVASLLTCNTQCTLFIPLAAYCVGFLDTGQRCITDSSLCSDALLVDW